MRLTSARKEMSEADFREFLGHLAADAGMWAAEFHHMDIAPLHIAFRCGEEEEKIVQDQQHLCAQLSDELRAVTADLLKRQTVSGDIGALMALQFLNINVVDLYRMLIDAAKAIADVMSDEEIELVDSLRGRIRAVQEQYGTYILKMAEHTLARAAVADAALDQGKRGEVVDYRWGKFQAMVCLILGCILLFAGGLQPWRGEPAPTLTAWIGGLFLCATGVGLLAKRRFGVVLVCVMSGMTLLIPLAGHRPQHSEGYLFHAAGLLFWGLPALFYYPKRWKALR
jgi:hypothetical protein